MYYLYHEQNAEWVNFEFHSASEQVLDGNKPTGIEEREWERRLWGKKDRPQTVIEERELQNNTGVSLSCRRNIEGEVA